MPTLTIKRDHQLNTNSILLVLSFFALYHPFDVMIIMHCFVCYGFYDDTRVIFFTSETCISCIRSSFIHTFNH